MGTLKLLLLPPLLVLTGCFGPSTCETENEAMKAMLARDREYAKEESRKIMKQVAEDARKLDTFRLP